MSRKARRVEEAEAPAIDSRKPDYMWNGLPVYRCRWCGDKYERVDKLDAVEAHEKEQHGPYLRPSAILGADGEPLTVEEA